MSSRASMQPPTLSTPVRNYHRTILQSSYGALEALNTRQAERCKNALPCGIMPFVQRKNELAFLRQSLEREVAERRAAMSCFGVTPIRRQTLEREIAERQAKMTSIRTEQHQLLQQEYDHDQSMSQYSREKRDIYRSIMASEKALGITYSGPPNPYHRVGLGGAGGGGHRRVSDVERDELQSDGGGREQRDGGGGGDHSLTRLPPSLRAGNGHDAANVRRRDELRFDGRRGRFHNAFDLDPSELEGRVRRIIIDKGSTELSDDHMHSMLRDTSDIVLPNVPGLADWGSEEEETAYMGRLGICPALQNLPTERLLARPCIGDDGGLAPELLELWGRNTRRITGPAGTRLPFRVRGERGVVQRGAVTVNGRPRDDGNEMDNDVASEEVDFGGNEGEVGDDAAVNLEHAFTNGTEDDDPSASRRSKRARTAKRTNDARQVNVLDDSAMKVIANINEHTRTEIKPSDNGLDRLGVFAGKDIPNGTVLFQTPDNYVAAECVQLTGEQIQQFVGNPVALHAIQNRFLPVEEANDPSEFVFDIPISGPNGLSAPDFIRHAASEDEVHNVRYGSKIDANGFEMLETVREIKEGEELLLEFSSEVAELFARCKSFIQGLIADKRGLAAARERASSGRNSLDENVFNLVENLNNNVCLMLRPSSVHGVGLLIGEGGSRLVKAGFDPLELPKGCPTHETVDITEGQMDELIECSFARSRIRRHCYAHLNDHGELVFPLPAGGFNAMDISNFINAASRFDKACHLDTISDKKDNRGLCPMVFCDCIELGDGDEVLSDYKISNNDGDLETVPTDGADDHDGDDPAFDNEEEERETEFEVIDNLSDEESLDPEARLSLSLETADSNHDDRARLERMNCHQSPRKTSPRKQTFYCVTRDAQKALNSLSEEDRKARDAYIRQRSCLSGCIEFTFDGRVFYRGDLAGLRTAEDMRAEGLEISLGLARLASWCNAVKDGSTTWQGAVLRRNMTPMLEKNLGWDQSADGQVAKANFLSSTSDHWSGVHRHRGMSTKVSFYVPALAEAAIRAVRSIGSPSDKLLLEERLHDALQSASISEKVVEIGVLTKPGYASLGISVGTTSAYRNMRFLVAPRSAKDVAHREISTLLGVLRYPYPEGKQFVRELVCELLSPSTPPSLPRRLRKAVNAVGEKSIANVEAALLAELSEVETKVETVWIGGKSKEVFTNASRSLRFSLTGEAHVFGSGDRIVISTKEEGHDEAAVETAKEEIHAILGVLKLHFDEMDAQSLKALLVKLVGRSGSEAGSYVDSEDNRQRNNGRGRVRVRTLVNGRPGSEYEDFRSLAKSKAKIGSMVKINNEWVSVSEARVRGAPNGQLIVSHRNVSVEYI